MFQRTFDDGNRFCRHYAVRLQQVDLEQGEDR